MASVTIDYNRSYGTQDIRKILRIVDGESYNRAKQQAEIFPELDTETESVIKELSVASRKQKFWGSSYTKLGVSFVGTLLGIVLGSPLLHQKDSPLLTKDLRPQKMAMIAQADSIIRDLEQHPEQYVVYTHRERVGRKHHEIVRDTLTSAEAIQGQLAVKQNAENMADQTASGIALLAWFTTMGVGFVGGAKLCDKSKQKANKRFTELTNNAQQILPELECTQDAEYFCGMYDKHRKNNLVVA